MLISITSTLLDLLPSPMTDHVVERWIDYMDTNVTTDLSGLSLHEAERQFLLEVLTTATDNDSLQAMWQQYMDQEGYTADSLFQALEDWLQAGGISTIDSETTWDEGSSSKWDSGLITWDGNDGVP